jgi:hypothetical protein
MAELNDVLAGEVMCSYGQGTSEDPAKRDPDACPRTATNITEEGYPYCGEHIEWFYAAVDAIDGKKS